MSAIKRAWKRLPEGVRRSAHEAVHAFNRAVLPYRVARRWRRGRKAAEPIVVLGLHSSVVGVGQGARLFVEALRQDGFEVQVIDACEALSKPHRDQASYAAAAAPSEGGVVVSHLNPPELEIYLQRTGALPLQGRRHIGYWAWELPTAPKSWRRAFAFVDEVWCPSEFTATALRTIAPANVPIRVVPHPVFVAPAVDSDRAHFGLPEHACVVLQAFDLRSTAARKNPFGGLEAYLRAVPTPSTTACLVFKVVGARAFSDIFSDLQKRVAARPDLILISAELSSTEMLQLVASADIVLSLHRAEGFGLLLAEAMWLGKPVVATAWSGNMDFMDADNSALVDCTFVPAKDPQGMYHGDVWAEPDIDHAARELGKLIAEPTARAALGQLARISACRSFSADAWQATIRAALDVEPAAKNHQPATSSKGLSHWRPEPQGLTTVEAERPARRLASR